MGMLKNIIFPKSFLSEKEPDSSFLNEYLAAKQYANVHLLNVDDIGSKDNLIKSLSDSSENKEIFYHGWMLSNNQYKIFYDYLNNKGYKLTNSLDQYLTCHQFNNWYSIIKDYTPKSLIINSSNINIILDSVLDFKEEAKSALIIKDSVKSLKHNWYEACYIPEFAEPLKIAKIIKTFLDIKKDQNDLNLPIIIRKFEKLKSIGLHEKSKMPISHEYRTYIYNGKIISQSPYWESNINNPPPLDFIKSITDKLIDKSNLFTIDSALKENGEWICIEVGDGQVSSLPDLADKKIFFSNLLGEI